MVVDYQLARCPHHPTYVVRIVELGRCTKKGVGIGNQKL
jgi:hypothetical protein